MKQQTRHFKVSARTLKSLGRDSVKDQFTAVLEVVKNSYDADATDVYIDINSKNQYISITDNGHGMSVEDFDDKWLVIGTSEKITNSISKKERRRVGEKGIGRLSCARLGNLTTLNSIKRKKAFYAQINWKEFEVPNKSLDQIKFKFNTLNITNFEEFNEIKHGLQVIIEDLIEDWSKDDISKLESEIKSLFSPSIKDQVFNIHLKTDLIFEYKDEFVKLLNSEDEEFTPEIQVDFKFNPNIINKFEVKSKLSGKIKKYKYELDYTEDKYVDLIGPFDIKLSFYATSGSSLDLINNGMKTNDIRRFLNNNYGIRVFRDSVRVKPYGDPRHSAGDWLQLGRRRASNPAGVGRKSYTMDVYKIIGRLEISADTNPLLEDNASREGIQDTIIYRKLKEILINVIKTMETTRHTEYILHNKPDPSKNKDPIDTFLTTLKGNLTAAMQSSTKTKNKDGSVNDNALSVIRNSLNEIDKTIPILEDFVSESIQLRSLASVGIISTVFAHEVKGDFDKISTALGLTQDKILKAENNSLSKLIPLIDDSSQRLSKVEMWSSLALNRVHIDKRKRKRFNIKPVVEKLFEEFKNIFSYYDITYEVKVRDYELRAFQMELDSIFVNLITNAIHACKESSRKKRIIRLTSSGDRGKYTLNFEDSGVGIPSDNFKKIWVPLYTTKKENEGTGLGLTIVKNTVNDLNGSIFVDKSKDLKGAKFTIEFKRKSDGKSLIN